MSIQPIKQNISEVFSAGQPYYIDFYQRDYKWQKEHIDKLLEDLFYRFELDYDNTTDVKKETTDTYDWYYLNAYVTNEHQGKTFIVDGQQRLTSITLILIKLYHLAKKYSLEKREKLTERHIYGMGVDGEEYWIGHNERRPVMEDLFKNREKTKEYDSLSITMQNLYNNYEIIDNTLEGYLDNAHKFESFLLYFILRVMLVKIHIEDSNDVPMVFEVINDRGERLKPYEVLKGKLLGQLNKNEVNEYDDIWDNQIHKLQKIDDNEVDNFFRFYFRSKYVNTVNEYRQYDGEYHKTIYSNRWDKVIGLKQNPPTVKKFIKDDLVFYSDLYFKYVNDPQSHILFNYLNDQDRQYLLILSSCTSWDEQRDFKAREVARLFDRFFSILHLTGSYDSNNFTNSVIELNKKIRGKSLDEIKDIFNQQLISDVSEIKGVKVEEPFNWNYFKDANNRNLGVRFIRYFFARIEHFIGENCNIPCEKYYNLVRNTGPKNGYHIEHILADNQENRALFDNDEELFHQERNRLGALTLLRGRDNISSGNETYRSKLETYAGKSNLVWTQTLREDFYHSNPNFKDFIEKYNLNFKPYPVKFDQQAITERQKLLFDMAKIIWNN